MPGCCQLQLSHKQVVASSEREIGKDSGGVAVRRQTVRMVTRNLGLNWPA